MQNNTYIDYPPNRISNFDELKDSGWIFSTEREFNIFVFEKYNEDNYISHWTVVYCQGTSDTGEIYYELASAVGIRAGFYPSMRNYLDDWNNVDFYNPYSIYKKYASIYPDVEPQVTHFYSRNKSILTEVIESNPDYLKWGEQFDSDIKDYNVSDQFFPQNTYSFNDKNEYSDGLNKWDHIIHDYSEQNRYFTILEKEIIRDDETKEYWTGLYREKLDSTDIELVEAIWTENVRMNVNAITKLKEYKTKYGEKSLFMPFVLNYKANVAGNIYFYNVDPQVTEEYNEKVIAEESF